MKVSRACVLFATTATTTTTITSTVAFTNPSSLTPLLRRNTGVATPKWNAASVEEDIDKKSGQDDVATAVNTVNGETVPKLPPSNTTYMDEQQIKAVEAMEEAMLQEITLESEKIVSEIMDEECAIDYEKDGPADELCDEDSPERQRFRDRFKSIIKSTIQVVRGTYDDIDTEGLSEGEILEKGWEQRANASSLVRNAEVWRFALKAAFTVLGARKVKLKGASDEELEKAQIEAAEYIRDGLLRLGPSFVKLGQVASTRTDVLPTTYTDVLKTLTDDVPGFSGKRAKEIVSAELGVPCDKVFDNFSEECVKAASLGQVHTATYKGKPVAIKVQRAGLKELFDTDLKNLKKLAVLLEKFDPKSDGADRNWVEIYEESEKQLYKEIDYLNEAANTERFRKDFEDYDWVKIPKVIDAVTTPRVLTMEFVESFKLTDIDRIEKLGLDRKLLANRVAEWFLHQIVETSFFHCDPHSGTYERWKSSLLYVEGKDGVWLTITFTHQIFSCAGNLCVNEKGELVVYDYGQMDELKPNVREGFRTFCSALFAGGPMISDLQLAQNAKKLVQGVEQAGVLSKSA